MMRMYLVKRTTEFDDWLAGIKDGLTLINHLVQIY
jgi:hypothetical protein